MKKLLIILSVLLLSSCEKHVCDLKDPIQDKFECKGHHYLVIRYHHNYIVHDPDCPCNNF